MWHNRSGLEIRTKLGNRNLNQKLLCRQKFVTFSRELLETKKTLNLLSYALPHHFLIDISTVR